MFADAPSSLYKSTRRHIMPYFNEGTPPSVVSATPFGFLGDYCPQNDDCSIDKSVCVNGFCRCRSGYVAAKDGRACLSGMMMMMILIRTKILPYVIDSRFSRYGQRAAKLSLSKSCTVDPASNLYSRN